MRIEQCYISVPLRKSIFKNILDYYSLVPYHDKRKPSVFWGFYNSKEDAAALKNHKSLAVLVWRGNDVFRSGHMKFVKKKPYIKSVAISSFIEKDLKSKKMLYKRVPLIGCDMNNIKPCPKGNFIYAYLPAGDKNKSVYGFKMVKKIREKIGHKIIVVDSPVRHTKKKILELYRNSFCGFRFTGHDGIANSVIEMGLMGRKSVYNDLYVPCSIHWSADDLDGILKAIDGEAKTIGQTDYITATATKNFINVGKNWLDTGFWN